MEHDDARLMEAVLYLTSRGWKLVPPPSESQAEALRQQTEESWMDMVPGRTRVGGAQFDLTVMAPQTRL